MSMLSDWHHKNNLAKIKKRREIEKHLKALYESLCPKCREKKSFKVPWSRLLTKLLYEKREGE